jgi:hypothetical protein
VPAVGLVVGLTMAKAVVAGVSVARSPGSPGKLQASVRSSRAAGIPHRKRASDLHRDDACRRDGSLIAFS